MTTRSPEIWITVSIHAPVRGATSTAAVIKAISLVSIHAPVRGATAESCRKPTS